MIPKYVDSDTTNDVPDGAYDLVVQNKRKIQMN